MFPLLLTQPESRVLPKKLIAKGSFTTGLEPSSFRGTLFVRNPGLGRIVCAESAPVESTTAIAAGKQILTTLIDPPSSRRLPIAAYPHRRQSRAGHRQAGCSTEKRHCRARGTSRP